MKTYDKMTPKELLEDYHRYEKMLFSMGRDYRNIPQDAFEKIEYWLNLNGYVVVRPKSGLSTIKRIK